MSGEEEDDWPRTDLEAGDGHTGEENRHDEEDFPAPDVRQGADQGRAQEREDTLEGLDSGLDPLAYLYSQDKTIHQELILREGLGQYLNILE